MLNNWILYKIICLSKKQFNDNCSNIFLQSHVTKCQHTFQTVANFLNVVKRTEIMSENSSRLFSRDNS